ncbi:MAG: PASTA domain-containing protein, partial [Clostridia bacterium]|nr:PASTA domain-containing protein [Clostridia bacterium]
CKIKLVVSGGEQKLTLGDFSVRDYRLVVSELRSLGLVCTVEKVFDDSVEIGYVVATDPESGSVVGSGDNIILFVSRGPEQGDISVPDFTGKTEAEALVLLAQLRLSAGNVIYERSDKDSGTIIAQSILPGTKVTAHTPVDLNVSGGPKYGKGAISDDSEDSDSDGSEPDSDTPITLPPIDKITDSSETTGKKPTESSSESESDDTETETETETESTESENEGADPENNG